MSTACRVASATPGLPLRTRLTVASLTSACSAMSASRALIACPSLLRRPAIACRDCRRRWPRPGPDVDPGRFRHERHAVATKDQIPAVCRVRLRDAGQVPRGDLDRVMRGARAVHQRRLLCALTQEHERVVVGMDPSQTAVPQGMTGVARRDEATVDLKYPCGRENSRLFALESECPGVAPAPRGIGRRPSSPKSPRIPISSPYVIIGMPGMVKSSPADVDLPRVLAHQGADPRGVVGPDQVEAVPDAAPRRDRRELTHRLHHRRATQTRHHERRAEELGRKPLSRNQVQTGRVNPA